MAAGGLDSHREPDGQGSELLHFWGHARPRENPGQFGAGVDRGSVREPLMARSPTVMREDLNDQEVERKSTMMTTRMIGVPDTSVTQRRDTATEISGAASPEAVIEQLGMAARTVTGKPLLSNDMHLGHQMPNLWYEAHLKCGNQPGSPDVAGGHAARNALRNCRSQSTRRVGFTNVGPTVADAFIELQRARRLPDAAGLAAAQARAEVIHIKGKPDVAVDVKITRHGPIITDSLPGDAAGGATLDAV